MMDAGHHSSNVVYRLIQFFTDLVLLREKPQNLPPSTALLGLVAVLYVLLNTLHMWGVFPSLWQGFGVSLTDLVVILVAVWLLLALKGLKARWLQTATALVGGGVVIVLLAIPLSFAIGKDEELTAVAEFAMLLYWMLIVWNQIFIGHVLRHALGVSLLAGIGLGLLYTILSGLVLQALFGPPVATGAGG